MLGPMVNPAFPEIQLVGVFNLELARLYNYLYQKTNKQYAILHTLDGYDEISLTSSFKLLSNQEDSLLSPQDLGFKTLNPEALFGGDTVADSAKVFEKILRGEGTEAQQDVVCANAGMAIHCAKPALSRQDCMALAKETLKSGKALTTFEKFLRLN